MSNIVGTLNKEVERTMIKSFNELAKELAEVGLENKERANELKEIFWLYRAAEEEALELGYVGVGCISYAERAIINYQKSKE